MVIEVIHSSYNLTYNELLSMEKMVNFRYLITGVFKCIHNLNTEFMWNIFKTKTIPYKLRAGGCPKVRPSFIREEIRNRLL